MKNVWDQIILFSQFLMETDLIDLHNTAQISVSFDWFKLNQLATTKFRSHLIKYHLHELIIIISSATGGTPADVP